MSAQLDLSDLPGDFGAVAIKGVTPGRSTDTDLHSALRSLLATHAVVCLRQTAALDESGFRALASIFGPIKDPVGRTIDGGTLRYGDELQIVDAGFVLTDELRKELGDLRFGGLDEQRPGLFETFHTDDSYTEDPASITVLHARDLPRDGGGATRFLDMRAAFLQLKQEVSRNILGHRARYRYNNGGAFPPRVSAEGPYEALVEVEHPIVRAHPITGSPALYIDLDRATSVVGVDQTKGRRLLQLLQSHAEKNAPSYAHSWQDHDVLVWDNASVQHCASGDFPTGEPRRFWRLMIEGSVPQAYSGH